MYAEWIEFSHVFLFKRKASNSEENTENGEGYQIATKWHHLSSFNYVFVCYSIGKKGCLGLGDWRSHSCPISCGCVTPTRITLSYLKRNTNMDRTKYTMELYFKRGKHTYVKWFCHHTVLLYEQALLFVIVGSS